MKSSTLIVWLLVAACIAIDLAMIAELQVQRNDWPGAGGLIGLGLAFAQVTLISLWAIWGRNSLPFRAIGSLLGVWGLSCLGSYSAVGGLGGVGPWFGLLLVYCAASLVLFIMARLASYAVSNQPLENSPGASNRSSSNQFTIWWLLSLMTAVGTALAVIRFAEFPMEELLDLAVVLSILSATGATVLILTLFLSRVGVAIIATMFISPIGGFLLMLTKLGSEARLEMVLLTCMQGLTILAAALVLRAGGFRVVRHNAPCGARASGSSVASASVAADGRDGP